LKQRILKLLFSFNKAFRDVDKNPNTQKIENPNPDSNLLALLGAYVCPKSRHHEFQTQKQAPFQTSLALTTLFANS